MRRLFVLLTFLACAYVSQAQTVVQMEKKGGVYYVPCTVNGLKLSFIFDTGASGVSISLSEAMFMLKNGYMSEDDLLDTEYYRIANGELAEGTKINLRSIVIGGKELRNVKASIVHSATAPLLLGQSVLERFGNVSVNYSNQTLVLGASVSDKSSQQFSTNNASSYSPFKWEKPEFRIKIIGLKSPAVEEAIPTTGYVNISNGEFRMNVKDGYIEQTVRVEYKGRMEGVYLFEAQDSEGKYLTRCAIEPKRA
jgi:clan AA aspartic protease (TIGR02281 family)